MTETETAHSDEIDLIDAAIVLAKHKSLIFKIAFGAAVISVIVSLLLPNEYTATAQILPPQQDASLANSVFSVLGISSSSGNSLGSALGLKDPNAVYIGMLQSQTTENNLIARFDLKTYYESLLSKLLSALKKMFVNDEGPLLSDTREALEKDVDIESDKSSMIIINVTNKSPEKAAEIANAYVEELEKTMNTLAVTEAARRRLFFEQQLKDAMTKLDQAERAARSAIDKGGVAKADAQGAAVVETTAQLRAQIAAKEIEIGAIRNYAADQNPDLLRARHEIDVMRQELVKLEGRGETSASNVSKENSSGDAGSSNLALLRDAKYYETLVGLLAQQFAMAKIDEAHDAAIVQVVDNAVPPDQKSKPKRALIVLITTVIASILAVLFAFFKEAMERTKQNPTQSKRLALLKTYFK